MSKKQKNPYREGSAYHAVFEDLSKAGQKGITRSELCEKHSAHDVTVVLSPRETARTGCDCRGNFSAQGHVYFVDVRSKAGEEKRFVMRWRKPELEKRSRNSQSVKQVKAKSKTKSKSKKTKTAKA